MERVKRTIHNTSASHSTKKGLSPRTPLLKQDFSIELCERVATLLSKTGVDNLLWGTHLLSVYTVPTVLLVRPLLRGRSIPIARH